MITFKSFLSEIDLDDSIYTKSASSVTSSRQDQKTLTALPSKLKFEIPGFELKWTPYNQNYKLVLIDNETGNSAITLELRAFTARVIVGNLIGVEAHSLSSHASYRGTGLAMKVYDHLIQNGQVLFSSNWQTTGSRKLWEKLVQKHLASSFVLAKEASARFYINRANAQMEYAGCSNVLLSGPFEYLVDEAYADSSTRWVIVPNDLTNLNKIKDGALQLPL